jgi:hypothetical protein
MKEATPSQRTAVPRKAKMLRTTVKPLDMGES